MYEYLKQNPENLPAAITGLDQQVPFQSHVTLEQFQVDAPIITPTRK